MIYDEQLRMPLSISWPARFKHQGARTGGARRGRRHRPDLPRAGGRPRPGFALPVAARPLAGARARRTPRARAGKDFTVSTCDEVWSPQDFAGVGKPWRRHVRAALSGRFKVARYVAMDGNPHGRAPRRPGLRALRPRRGPLRAPQPRASTPPTSRCSTTCSPVLAELERKRLGPVEVPALRRPPRCSSRSATTRSAGRRRPSPQLERRRSPVAGLPGAYVQLPIGDPHLEQRVYEDSGGERLPADRRRVAGDGRGPRPRSAPRCSASSARSPRGAMR